MEFAFGDARGIRLSNCCWWWIRAVVLGVFNEDNAEGEGTEEGDGSFSGAFSVTTGMRR